jgi:SOS-response transcriptional repressor LexA
MPSSKKPSKVQLETLKHIKDYIEAHQYSPTVAELAASAGVTPNCVTERLGALVKLKLITKKPGIARSIRPVEHADDQQDAGDTVISPPVDRSGAQPPQLQQ